MRNKFVFAAMALLPGCNLSPPEEPYIEPVKAELVDPESAQFRNVVRYNNTIGGLRFCGEVNARNRMGGYTGFTEFTYSEVNGVKIKQSDIAMDGLEAANQSWEFLKHKIDFCKN